MKLAFRITLLALILTFSGSLMSSATTQTFVTHDGAWWQSLSRDEKITAVEGMLVGYSAGWEDAAFRSASDISTRLQRAGKNVGRSVAQHRQQLIDEEPQYGSRTFGVMVSKLDEVFNKYPKLSKTRVSLFVTCAVTSGENCLGLGAALAVGR